jgi:hypothetical protein
MTEDPSALNVGETMKPVDNSEEPEVDPDAVHPRIPQGFHK